jgi:hypothetical protein
MKAEAETPEATVYATEVDAGHEACCGAPFNPLTLPARSLSFRCLILRHFHDWVYHPESYRFEE